MDVAQVLYQKAARQCVAKALSRLGQSCLMSTSNKYLAHKYVKMAALRGDEYAQGLSGHIDSLSSAERAKADKEAAAWTNGSPLPTTDPGHPAKSSTLKVGPA